MRGKDQLNIPLIQRENHPLKGFYEYGFRSHLGAAGEEPERISCVKGTKAVKACLWQVGWYHGI